ncbi:MAG: hypothetical protein ACM3TU_02005 [Bacillota bacterium]
MKRLAALLFVLSLAFSVSTPVSAQADVPVITDIQAPDTPKGTIYPNQSATVYGSGLSGPLTIQIGNAEPQYVNAVGNGTSVSFTVPSRLQTIDVSVSIITLSGIRSNYFPIIIFVPKNAPPQTPYVSPTPVATPKAPNLPLPTSPAVITNIQSVTNPDGVVDAGRRATIHGTGLAGPLTITFGVKNPQIVKTTGTSDGYAEFTIPSLSISSAVQMSVTNATGVKSNALPVTIQSGQVAVHSNSVEELLRKGGTYDAGNLVAKTGPLTVAPGVIRTETMEASTTNTALILTVGNRSISVEPTDHAVVIKDTGLEVQAPEVTITTKGLQVGNDPVEVSASQVVENLSITPKTIELTTQNNQAVYDIQSDENRKLFGLIPLIVSTKMRVDAGDAELLRTTRPWYRVLTTR